MTRLDYTYERRMILQREEGREEGFAEGRTEGEAQKLILQVYKKILKSKSRQQIAEELEEAEENIDPIYNEINKMLPVFDAGEIYKRMKSRQN